MHIHAIINSFHNKLKNNPQYLDLNRRLDDLIHILLKLNVTPSWLNKQNEYVCTIRNIHIILCIYAPKIMKSANDASVKLEGKRHKKGLDIASSSEEAFQIGSAVDTLTILKLQSSQQVTLHDYFTKM